MNHTTISYALQEPAAGPSASRATNPACLASFHPAWSVKAKLSMPGSTKAAGFHQSGSKSCSETPASAVNFSRMGLLDEGNAGAHRDGISPTGPWVFSVSPKQSEPSIEGKWRTEVHSSRNLMDRGGSMRENQYSCQDLKNPGEQASAGEVSGLGSSPINNPVRSQPTNASFWLTRSNSQGWVLVLTRPAKQKVTFHDSFTRSNHVLSFWR